MRNTTITIPALLLLLANTVQAQQRIVGRVSDNATGQPIIGAVVQAGKGLGTVTDADGRFSISVSEFPAPLSIDYTGYRKEYVDVYDNTDSLYVNLQEDANLLGEAVVVGYGTQKRLQLTGAQSTIGAEAFQLATTPTLDGALSGAVAGLNITAASGQPGAASQIRIRGGNSVNASNEPLYVIDGLIYYKEASASQTGLGAIESSLSPLATINPSDIESVEVLKDVSATAIYGSRGANGVIIVTTRKGKHGQSARINYRLTAGFDNVSRRLSLLNASQWAAFQKTYYNNKGGYTDEQIASLGNGTDWQDAVLRQGFRLSHDVSVSGGSEKGRYAFSGSYSKQDGVVLNSGFKRYNLHVNTDYELRPGLTLGVQGTAGRSQQDGLTTTEAVKYNSSPYSAGITNSFVYALLTPPVVPVYNADGTYNYGNPYEYAYFAIGSQKANAVSDLQNSVAQSINNYLLFNAWARYELGPFALKASLGLNREHITQNYFSPSYTSLGLANNGLGGIGNKRGEVWQQEYLLTYTRQLTPDHYIDALAGYTRQSSTTNFNSVLVTHFTNETLKHNNLADGSDIYPPQTGETEATLDSWIGRVNYTYLNRYNATATIRADHSSRFASSHRWGYFPSLGLSWNVDKEPFWSRHSKVDALKVRASVGTVGNQEIGDYEFAQSYTAAQYDGKSSYTKQNADNAGLKWETTTSFNIGADLSLFHHRVSITADVYHKKTSDLLLNVPIGFAQGVSTQLQNVGNVTNTGVELAVDATLLQGKDLTWTVQGNVAHNRNKLTSLGQANEVIQGDAYQGILREGEALGTFYGLQFLGIVQEGEDVSLLPKVNGSTPRAGDIKYADTDGNNRIDGEDRVVLGSIQPKLTYGFSTQLNWKQWDLSLHFAGQYGSKVYNALARRLEQTGDSYNLLSTVLDSWTRDNASNTLPLASNTRPTSYVDSRYVQSSSYLKLRNATVGYTLRVKRPYLDRLRFFVTGSNLFTITPYKGYDPEVASGTDSGAYPSSRTFVAGIDITF